jgi:hypothetical protein
VRLYAGGGCSGPPVAAGTAAELAGPGLRVSVADDTVTTLRAMATVGPLRSECSRDEIVYVEDSSPPLSRITFAPARKTRKRSPVFRFADITENQGTTFFCAADRRRFRPCRAPKRLKKLRPGRHVFRVRAVDAAGNRERRAVKRRFKVVRR